MFCMWYVVMVVVLHVHIIYVKWLWVMVAVEVVVVVCVCVCVCMSVCVCMCLFTCVHAWGKETTKKKGEKKEKLTWKKIPTKDLNLKPRACGATVLSSVLLPKC